MILEEDKYMTKKDIKISIFVIISDIILFLFFFNVKYFIKHFVEEYYFVDIFLGCIVIISTFINTIVLVLIRRKIFIKYYFDLFLIHIIIVWLSFLMLIIKNNIFGFRPFIFPIIMLIIYIVFSIIIKKKKYILRQNDT